MKIKSILFMLIICHCTSCQIYDPGFDYKNFKGTPVEELAKAVQNDNVDEINRLVKEEKMDINYTEKKFKNTVLNLAVVYQNAATVETLLKLGAKPNMLGGKYNSTALIDAIEYTYPARTCDASNIKLLIKYGADVNTISNDTLNNRIDTVLMLACENGCLDVVKSLVENGADINKTTKYEGHGALTYALIHNNIEIAKYLIVDKGANVPQYVLKRDANINYIGEPEVRFTITDMLLRDDYSNSPANQKAKEEILDYLEKIGKK